MNLVNQMVDKVFTVKNKCLTPLAEQKAIVKRVDELMTLLDAMKG